MMLKRNEKCLLGSIYELQGKVIWWVWKWVSMPVPLLIPRREVPRSIPKIVEWGVGLVKYIHVARTLQSWSRIVSDIGHVLRVSFRIFHVSGCRVHLRVAVHHRCILCLSIFSIFYSQKKKSDMMRGLLCEKFSWFLLITFENAYSCRCIFWTFLEIAYPV